MSGIEYLLDTNILIGLLKQEPGALELINEFQLDFSNSAVSQITRMELLSFPGMPSGEEETIRSLLANCTVLSLDQAVEERAIALRKATRCKLPDAIIAATAEVNGLRLITLDERLRKVLRQ